ncbi:PAS domain-containing protein [Streptomyces sp. NPDC090303]|uniref:PAS domain-containing protein n=1 Tax=Streptomyces sp. NPDC090303 TaxID=3365960 RepID=UPI00381E4D96
MWTTDLDLNVTDFVNGARINYFSRPLHSAIGRDRQFSFVLGRASGPDIAAHVRARAGETTVWRMGRTGGLLACASPMRSDHGETVGVVGVAVDVSEMEEHLEQKETMEQLFHSLAGSIPMSVSIDEGGPDVLVYGNATAFPTDGSSMSWHSGVHTMQQGRASVTLRVDSEGNTPEPVLEPARRMRLLSDAVELPLVALDQHQRIEFVNDAWETLLGGDSGHYEGTDMARWVSPASAASYEALLASCGRRDDTGGTRLILVGTNQRAVAVDVRARCDGAAGGCVWTARQVGELSQALSSPSRLMVSALDAKIIELLAVGCSNAEIANETHLSRQGLDYRLKTLRRVLNAGSRGALVARAYSVDLLETCGSWPPRLNPDRILVD